MNFDNHEYKHKTPSVAQRGSAPHYPVGRGEDTVIVWLYGREKLRLYNINMDQLQERLKTLPVSHEVSFEAPGLIVIKFQPQSEYEDWLYEALMAELRRI
jgi:hypothetical protein